MTTTESETANDGAPSEREWVSAREACAILDVKKETLYAYASRGTVRSQNALGKKKTRVYHREDLKRLRARSQARAGHGPVAAAALQWGEPVLATRVGTIQREGPIYRGRCAVDLATEKKSFEEVCELLWQVPFAPSTVGPGASSPNTRDTRGLGVPAPSIRALLRRGAGPYDAMLITAAALAAAEPRGEVKEVAARRGGVLVRRLIASCALTRGVDEMNAALAADSCARSLLIALGGRTTPAAVSAMAEALVLTADHELNVSTFAARVAASSGASLSAAVVAALAALSGPLHGAATARVEAFALEIDRPECAAEVVAGRLERGESIPGFGHPLYPEGDPRGLRLEALAGQVQPRARAVRVLRAVASTVELTTGQLPTLDVGLVALSSALGLPRGAPLAIFACGRLAGWIAHALEQREAGTMLRPRAQYIGTPTPPTS